MSLWRDSDDSILSLLNVRRMDVEEFFAMSVSSRLNAHIQFKSWASHIRRDLEWFFSIHMAMILAPLWLPLLEGLYVMICLILLMLCSSCSICITLSSRIDQRDTAPPSSDDRAKWTRYGPYIMGPDKYLKLARVLKTSASFGYYTPSDLKRVCGNYDRYRKPDPIEELIYWSSKWSWADTTSTLMIKLLTR